MNGGISEGCWRLHLLRASSSPRPRRPRLTNSSRTPVAGSERPPLPHARRVGDTDPDRLPQAAAPAATKPGFSGAQLAELYGFPTGSNGAGQTVAIIELGGGYKAADLAHYWSAEGITPVPKVVAVSVDGAKNKPVGDPN